MARERAFSDQDVINAVNELRKVGKSVNKTNLRLKVGSGSPAVLYSVYEELLGKGGIKEEDVKKQEVAVVQTEERPLPSATAEAEEMLIQTIKNMIRDCNNTNYQLHETRVFNEVKSARAKVEAAELERDTVQQDLDQQLEALADAEDIVSDLRELNEGLRVDQGKLEKEIALLKKDLENEKAARKQDLTKFNVDLADLESELSDSNQLVEGLTVKITDLESDNKTLKNQLDTSEKRVSELKDDLKNEKLDKKQAVTDCKADHVIVISELKASHGNLIDKYEADLKEKTDLIAKSDLELKDNAGLIIKKDKEIESLKAEVKTLKAKVTDEKAK